MRYLWLGFDEVTQANQMAPKARSWVLQGWSPVPVSTSKELTRADQPLITTSNLLFVPSTQQKYLRSLHTYPRLFTRHSS
jgi:hypothetical protein